MFRDAEPPMRELRDSDFDEDGTVGGADEGGSAADSAASGSGQASAEGAGARAGARAHAGGVESLDESSNTGPDEEPREAGALRPRRRRPRGSRAERLARLPAPSELLQLLLGKVEFLEDDWRGVSVEARDLILCLCRVRPEHRLTPAQALRHAWLMQLPLEGCIHPDELPRNVGHE
jgi:hypothetical protein